MGRIVNSTFVSLDGVINHMEAWHFAYIDDESIQIATEQLFASDALLMGRHAYEVYADAWPGREGEYADRINSLRKYVASTTLKEATWANTTVIRSGLVEEVARLKQQEGGDILMHGFGPVARTLLAHDLLDELHLWVHPAFAGVGTTDDMLFSEGNNAKFELLGTRTLKSGIVLLSYRTVGAANRQQAAANQEGTGT
jgi:dihydrofolate reductase